MVKLNIK